MFLNETQIIPWVIKLQGTSNTDFPEDFWVGFTLLPFVKPGFKTTGLASFKSVHFKRSPLDKVYLPCDFTVALIIVRIKFRI